jgi:lipoprotein-releasing system ATP-binding protein
MMKTTILKATHLTKTFASPALVEVLKQVDIEVSCGESVAIVGKSGEGKSTLLHILGTLEKPCSGRLEICGQNTAHTFLPKLRNEHIGFIFQSYNLLDEYTTLENVLMPAKIARKAIHHRSSAYKRALELLSIVGISDRAHFPAKLLSGGQKQRAAIARALCNDPSLILADEPSGNLDHRHSTQVHSLLLDLCKNFNKALIVVTHDKELSSLCGKRLQLKDGNLFPLYPDRPQTWNLGSTEAPGFDRSQTDQY